MFAEVAGHRVYYTTYGHGRPLLLMHGGPGLDHTYFRPWLDPLGERAELIYYDQLGQGRTERPASWEGVTHETWAAEADALRAYLGHERIILLGHSYGGFIAQDYALRYGEHLDGLILSDTAPVLDYMDVIGANAAARGTPEQLQVVGGLSDPYSLSGDAAFRKAWRTILPLYFQHYDPELGDAMDEQTQYSGAAYAHGFAKCLPVFNTLPRLGEIRTPTLVISGRHDWITPPAQGAERLHAAIPNSQLVILENSGHFPFIEERDRYVGAVADWLSRLG